MMMIGHRVPCPDASCGAKWYLLWSVAGDRNEDNATGFLAFATS